MYSLLRFKELSGSDREVTVLEFKKRNTEVIGLSVDSVEDHQKWKRDIEAFAGAPPDSPIFDDTSLKVAKLFDMLPAHAYLPDGRTATAEEFS